MNRYTGGALPYGYRLNPDDPALLARDPQEWPAVEKIRELNSYEIPYRQIATALQLRKREFPPRGRAWHHCTVAQILGREEREDETAHARTVEAPQAARD